MIQEGTAFAVLLSTLLLRADGSDVNLAEMEWHGGAKIFHSSEAVLWMDAPSLFAVVDTRVTGTSMKHGQAGGQLVFGCDGTLTRALRPFSAS